MSLITMKQLYSVAERIGFAVPGYDTCGGQLGHLDAVLRTAEELNSPIIVSDGYKSMTFYFDPECYAEAAKMAIRKATIPAVFHLDHSFEFDHVALAIKYGFMGIMMLLACWLVDITGRRPLWMFASALMALVTALTGIVFHFHLSGVIVLIVLMLCTVPHGLALGPLPWLMMSEIFPNRIRAKAVAITTAFLWVTIFSGAQLFPILSDCSEKVLGSVGGAFWLFTVICIAAFFFGWKILPETKGRTLEEIAKSWTKR